MDETCIWCSHPSNVHFDGGCNYGHDQDPPIMCGCGHDPDSYPEPEPDRGDPWEGA